MERRCARYEPTTGSVEKCFSYEAEIALVSNLSVGIHDTPPLPNRMCVVLVHSAKKKKSPVYNHQCFKFKRKAQCIECAMTVTQNKARNIPQTPGIQSYAVQDGNKLAERVSLKRAPAGRFTCLRRGANLDARQRTKPRGKHRRSLQIGGAHSGHADRQAGGG